MTAQTPSAGTRPESASGIAGPPATKTSEARLTLNSLNCQTGLGPQPVIG